MNKLMALALIVAVLFASTAFAQPKVGVYATTVGGANLDARFTVQAGVQFDIVTVIVGVPTDFNAFEITVPELTPTYPGIFKLNEAIYGNAVDLGDVPGEHIVGLGFCESSGNQELIRTTYGPFGGGVPANDYEVAYSGTDPSSFGPANVTPGISTCAGTLEAIEPKHFWDTAGPAAAPGSLILMPTLTWVGTDPMSMGTLKARF